MRNEYDVIIVGAGPGGSATAKKCAELGLSVAVFEKRPSIGSEKRCGEGLSSLAADRLGLNIPKQAIAQTIDGAIIYAPNGKQAVIDFGKTAGYILERKYFDKWLAMEASRAGAYFQAKTPVTGLIREDGFIKGVRAEFQAEPFEARAKIVVAADGVESRVSRWAGLNTTNKLVNIDSGYQFEMSNIEISDPHKIHLFFGNKIAPRGYVWLFPKGKDVANVGVGVALCEKPARYYLEEFVKKEPTLSRGSIIEVNAGGIPVGGLLDNMVLNGFLAVGDAAHQVNPIHGGGMKESTIAGRIAGEVIAQAIQKGDVSRSALSLYNKRWWETRGNELKRVQKLREVVEKLSDDDFNKLADSGITGEDLMEMSRGKRFSVLAKVLMKNPRLVALARHLL
ncbi:MAG: NAD(P)/FAD-dependent oxidoreductase [Candidatus Aenigmatarchaeota archaeon]